MADLVASDPLVPVFTLRRLDWPEVLGVIGQPARHFARMASLPVSPRAPELRFRPIRVPNPVPSGAVGVVGDAYSLRCCSGTLMRAGTSSLPDAVHTMTVFMGKKW
jgi:hypothetical protein